MQHKRNTYLVNPHFQFRFIFYVCSWVLGLSLIYPLIIYSLFDYFMRFAAVDSYGPTLVALYRVRSQILILLALLELLVLGVLVGLSFILSHRIAGPLYKLQNAFNEVRKGNYKGTLTFRKYDHFKELAKDYNAMLEAVRNQTGKGQTAKSSEALSAAISHTESALGHVKGEGRHDLEKALAALRELKKQA